MEIATVRSGETVHMEDSQNTDEPLEPQIEGPPGLLPDLTTWGIEQYDLGICEDTFDNRKIIRENKARWIDVYGKHGEPTHLIQVVTAEMQEARLTANKSVLLKDPRDADSDYISGFDLIIEPRADNLVPAWVLAATRHWEDVAEKRQTIPNFRPALMGPPTRCLARTVNGRRCTLWSNGTAEYNGFCKQHLAQRPGDMENKGANTLTKARNRLVSAALGSVEGLEELALTATSEPVRLNAYKELLDRAGIRGGVEVDTKIEINVKPAAEEVKERLAKLAKGVETVRALEEKREQERQEELEALTVDAEVVEEDEP